MALFTWSKKYSVGVKAMDEQHTQLIGLMNEFHAAMMKGNPESIAAPILRKLADYVREHFSAEEALMKEHKYPGLAEQQLIHQELIRKVGDLVTRYEKGDQTVFISLLKGMHNGITNHVLIEDMKYAPWMKEHGVR
jgi:hemerythrin-like metal-binding protein